MEDVLISEDATPAADLAAREVKTT